MYVVKFLAFQRYLRYTTGICFNQETVQYSFLILFRLPPYFQPATALIVFRALFALALISIIF